MRLYLSFWLKKSHDCFKSTPTWNSLSEEMFLAARHQRRMIGGIILLDLGGICGKSLTSRGEGEDPNTWRPGFKSCSPRPSQSTAVSTGPALPTCSTPGNALPFILQAPFSLEPSQPSRNYNLCCLPALGMFLHYGILCIML